MDDFGQLRFAVADRVIITGRRRSLSSLEAVRQRLERGEHFESPVALLAGIVEQIAVTMDSVVEELSAEIDLIEDTILKEGLRDDRIRLGRARLTSVRVHRRLNGLRSLLRRLGRGNGEGLMSAIRAAVTPLAQRLDEIDHDVIEVRDRARLLQDELSARVAEETNRHLRLLAVLTAAFLPPTLVAGLFGMNVGGVPFVSETFGFWIAVAATAASSAILLLALKAAGLFR